MTAEDFNVLLEPTEGPETVSFFAFSFFKIFFTPLSLSLWWPRCDWRPHVINMIWLSWLGFLTKGFTVEIVTFGAFQTKGFDVNVVKLSTGEKNVRSPCLSFNTCHLFTAGGLMWFKCTALQSAGWSFSHSKCETKHQPNIHLSWLNVERKRLRNSKCNIQIFFGTAYYMWLDIYGYWSEVC